MINTGTILFVAFIYMGLLFAIAYYGDKRADSGRSIISNPYIYALSMAVYCTAWTYYGSVGSAVDTGLMFLTIYIGPTLMATLGWVVLRKIIRISKVHRITSIADFISSRYGKSTTLGGFVTIIAVIGVVPYISIQLKAISTSFLLVNQYPQISSVSNLSDIPIFGDTAFYVALILAFFAILFGTRHLDATERHEGLVAAIAFESIVKLAAFLCVGMFVTYVMHDGVADLVKKAAEIPDLRTMFTIGSQDEGSDTLANWSIYIFLSMMAILFLPRQFQLAVVENVNEEHLRKAIWLFPLYLLAINIFVIPVALSGVIQFQDGGVNADTFVLTLPMVERQKLLTLFIFLGGVSAATGMVIVETLALSIMISNDLIMPLLLRMPSTGVPQTKDFRRLLLVIRRGSIILVILLGYFFFHYVGEFYTLVSIGLVSFVAVAQFAPAILGGIFWKGGTKRGAMWGLIAGFTVWAYTLFIPSLVQAGFVPQGFVNEGLFGIELLKPFQLFGLDNFNRIAHAVFWSMLANVGTYVGVSIFSRASTLEHAQATLFVDVFRYSDEPTGSHFWRGTAFLPDLRSLLRRVLGRKNADRALAQYAEKRNIIWDYRATADAHLVSYAEKLLAGAIGSASARVMVSSVVKEESLGINEVMDILDETRQVIAYSRELEKATSELKAANERLKELDRLKDEFISTVTHELRTPLASVRSLAEILHDNPDLDHDRYKNFTAIIIKESERLTRLISQILDYERIESERMEWVISSVNLRNVIHDALQSTQQLIQEKNINVELTLDENAPEVECDRDRIIQVMVNLISNAVKFCESDSGLIKISLQAHADRLQVDVQDNGIGIDKKDFKLIFERFQQISDGSRGRPPGSGIGLTICKRIIDFHDGQIWVKSKPRQGSTFSFFLPLVK
jgi:Na+/proline symporter/nitrogen-specific signal transduction histidine kinase